MRRKIQSLEVFREARGRRGAVPEKMPPGGGWWQKDRDKLGEVPRMAPQNEQGMQESPELARCEAAGADKVPSPCWCV